MKMKYADGGEVEKQRNKEIAETILQQLGGGSRLAMMVGAYNFVIIPNGVAFRIKNAKANVIKITLNGLDLYDLEVGRMRGTTYKVVVKHDNIYNDMLKPLIEKATGMYLSLYKQGGKMEKMTKGIKSIASRFGKKAYEGGKSLVGKGVAKGKEGIKEGKRKIALDVIDSTKDKVGGNKNKIILKGAEELVRDKYSKGGGVKSGGVRIFKPLSSEKEIARKKLKENIIKALFIDKKSVVTEVTFTHQGKYSVGNINKQDIKNIVLEINESKKYNPIKIYTNSYGVLTLEIKDKYSKGGKMAKGGNTDDTPKIYVADLHAYNDGKLIGEWLDLSDYEDGEEVMEAIQKIVDKWKAKYGEEHEEFAIHDFENFSRDLYSEYMSEDSFDKVVKIYKISKERGIPQEVLGSIAREYNVDGDDLEEWIDDHYEGQFDSDEDLAYNYVEMVGGVNELDKKTLENYFDYESFGRDLAYDYTEFDGYYFRSYKRGGNIDKKYDLMKYLKMDSAGWSYSIGGL